MHIPDTESPPQLTSELSGDLLHLYPEGDWMLGHADDLEGELDEICENLEFSRVVFHVDKLKALDTFGAFLLARFTFLLDGGDRPWEIEGDHDGARSLLPLTTQVAHGERKEPARPYYDAMVRLGGGIVGGFQEAYETLAFLGRIVTVILRMMTRPKTIRWRSVVTLIETVGIDAIPIISALCFFIGAVVAFMGATLLEQFGGQIFTVDLVGLSILREFGALITAIMLAGRSDSAFTAQIGSMKMRQEIDALNVMGMDTDEVIVAPRALACLVSAPILTVCAMISGIAGGMVVSWMSLDISPSMFLVRLDDSVAIQHFWVGMVKAPFFAIVIAMIGCRQGLAVEGDVESLGKRTTSSVVQSIFAVIVIDAIFAMICMQLGV